MVTAMDVAVSQAAGDNQARKAIQLYGSDILTRDLLLPVWDRADERQADHLGVDLMVRAGYNPSEVDSFSKYWTNTNSSMTICSKTPGTILKTVGGRIRRNSEEQ